MRGILRKIQWTTANVAVQVLLLENLTVKISRVRGKKQRVKSIFIKDSEIPDVQKAIRITIASWPSSLVKEEIRPIEVVSSMHGSLTFGWIPYGRFRNENGLIVRQTKYYKEAIVVEQADARDFANWLCCALSAVQETAEAMRGINIEM